MPVPNVPFDQAVVLQYRPQNPKAAAARMNLIQGLSQVTDVCPIPLRPDERRKYLGVNGKTKDADLIVYGQAARYLNERGRVNRYLANFVSQNAWTAANKQGFRSLTVTKAQKSAQFDPGKNQADRDLLQEWVLRSRLLDLKG